MSNNDSSEIGTLCVNSLLYEVVLHVGNMIFTCIDVLLEKVKISVSHATTVSGFGSISIQYCICEECSIHVCQSVLFSNTESMWSECPGDNTCVDDDNTALIYCKVSFINIY